MPRHGRSNRDFQQQVRERRRIAVEEGWDGGFPLFVYSYSSRGFPDLPERYIATRSIPPVHLVSLYDLHHSVISDPVAEATQKIRPYRFLDSGNYEIGPSQDPLDLQGSPGRQPWDEKLYITAACVYAHPGDVLVSFDVRGLSINNQAERAAQLFQASGEHSGVRRDLLLHPAGAPPESVVETIAAYSQYVDLVGITEKDIGGPWFLAAAYVRQLRSLLNAAFDRYVPIHIFGCLDPRTLPYLFLSGADVFDGLAWMRYYFRDGHAYYSKEFEFTTAAEILLDEAGAARLLCQHNVAELERLRVDLRYFVTVGDVGPFQRCLEDLYAMES